MTAARILRAAAAAALLAAPQAGWPVFDPVNDDTDIFLANPALSSARPNVLIVIDNSANWGQATGFPAPWDSKYGGVKESLVAIARDNTIINSGYNVGLAMFGETGGNNNNTGGMYLRYGIRQMSGDVTDETTNRGRFVQLVDRLAKSSGTGDGTNNTDYSLSMYEIYEYFAGLSSFAGHGKEKTDAGDNVYVTGLGRLPLAGSPLPSGAIAKTSGPLGYTSPITDGCQKNFVIVISNGAGSDPNASLADAQVKLGGVSGTASPAKITITPNGEEGYWSDEFAKFMANSDCNPTFQGVQNVITYTIDVLPDAGGQGPAHSAMLRSMADAGKGKYFAVTDTSSTGQLEQYLKTILSEVQAENSVFASTTLPVSVNVRGTNLNQVYIGVFRPDSNKSPRWLGNLKLYKLGVNDTTKNLFLADANGTQAENSSTGFISNIATSFWTDSSCFWRFRGLDPNLSTAMPGSCSLSTINTLGSSGYYPLWSDRPDGDKVEKGGAAQRLRVAYAGGQPAPDGPGPDNTTRKMYTCLDTTPTGACTTTGLSSTSFTNANVTAGDLGTFLTQPVVSLSSAGLVATAKVTAHGWATGDEVQISGASPTAFNLRRTITKVDADTFTYPLDVAPDATRARFTVANHGLANNDLLYFIDYDAYNACWSANPGGPCYPYPGYSGYFVPATFVDANHFDYTPAEPQTTAKTTDAYGFQAWGGRVPAYSIGVLGADRVIVSLPGHGYTSTTFSNSYLYPPTFTYPYQWYFGYGFMNVIDTNTVEIQTYKNWYETTYGVGSCPGCFDPIAAPADIALVTTTIEHGFATGQTVTMTGSANPAFNGNVVITKVTNSSFYFTSASTTPDSPAAAARAGRAVVSITHPTTGSAASRNTATVTTTGVHGLSAGASVQIFGTAADFNSVIACLGYNNNSGVNQVAAWTVQSVPTTTTFTISNGNINTCPASLTSALLPNMFAGYAAGKIQPAKLNQTNQVVLRFLIPSPTLISPLTSASGNILAGRPLDADTTGRDALIAWVRSADNKDNENLNAIATDARASAHGDVLHSRPATINYNRLQTLITGTDTDSLLRRDSDIYAFYGSNDGVLHAVKGGVLQKPNPATGGSTFLSVTVGPDASVQPGTERWAFIPKEFFGKLKRLREQTPTISNISQKDYFFDGSIGVFQRDALGNGNAASPLNCIPGSCSGADTVAGVIGDNVHPTKGDKVILFVSLRRGGNFLYALDVTVPTAPKLLWRKGNGDTGWGEVGQTWSEPKLTKTSIDLGNANNPDNVILIFGAGYDDAPDDVNPCLVGEWYSDRVIPKAVGTGTVTYTATGSCTIAGGPGGLATAVTRKLGRGILVVDAFSGAVLWQAGADPKDAAHNLKVPDMTCAISSDVTVLDKNRQGFANRLYVGDTCGNVWRADISLTDFDKWTVTKIAALSGTGATPVTDKLKFLFPPDLVFDNDGTTYTAVLLGAGDREHPFDALVQNAFFMIKDRDSSNILIGAPNNTTVSIAASSPDGALAAPVAKSALFDATNVVVNGSDPKALKGWFVDLRPGEKVVSSAVTISGTTFFNTNQPSSTAANSCNANLGDAFEYQVGFADASATSPLNGGALSIANRSTKHAGGGYLPSPVPVVVEIDGKKYQAVISGTSVQTPPGLTLEKRTRAFWYKQID